MQIYSSRTNRNPQNYNILIAPIAIEVMLQLGTLWNPIDCTLSVTAILSSKKVSVSHSVYSLGISSK